MRSIHPAVLAAAVLLLLPFAPHAAATKLLRFPDVWRDRIVFSYAGDLWTVGTRGGTAARLTSNPGLELFELHFEIFFGLHHVFEFLAIRNQRLFPSDQDFTISAKYLLCRFEAFKT